MAAAQQSPHPTIEDKRPSLSLVRQFMEEAADQGNTLLDSGDEARFPQWHQRTEELVACALVARFVREYEASGVAPNHASPQRKRIGNRVRWLRENAGRVVESDIKYGCTENNLVKLSQPNALPR
jgi:hypothetical protein